MLLYHLSVTEWRSQTLSEGRRKSAPKNLSVLAKAPENRVDSSAKVVEWRPECHPVPTDQTESIEKKSCWSSLLDLQSTCEPPWSKPCVLRLPRNV